MLLLLLISGVSPSFVLPVFVACCQVAASSFDTTAVVGSCYTQIDTTTPYDILERAVGTQRDCEILCDGKAMCSGFSYKATSLIDPCVLLSTAIPNKMCAAKTTIYVKGCGGPITLMPTDEPKEPTTSATSTTTTITPTTEQPTTTTTTFSGGAGRMIGYVQVIDPAPLRLKIVTGSLDVSNYAQWNTATSIIIDVLASGCTITVTDELQTYTADQNTAKTTLSVSNIKRVEGVCSS